MISEKLLSAQLGIDLKRERLKGVFKIGEHYFKYSERKIIYDEDAIYRYIRERNGKYLCEEQRDLGEFISKWAEGAKVPKTSRHTREQKAS